MSYICKGKVKDFRSLIAVMGLTGAYDRNLTSTNTWVYNSVILQGIVSEC